MSTERGPYTTLHNLASVVNFLLPIDWAFRPGVCLWLVHLRGNLSRITQSKTTKPWISQFWKRIVDWSLVVIVFLVGISQMAVLANKWVLLDRHQLTPTEYRTYLNVDRGLKFTSVAFGVLLEMNVIVSFIGLKVSQKRMNFVDPIATRLLVAVLPFVLLDLLEYLVFPIYAETHKVNDYDPNSLTLADTIISGVVRVGIIWGLLSTMTIPNVVWGPGVAAAGLGYMPQRPQPPQQAFYQPMWQHSPSIPPPGQRPHSVQYQSPQNPPPTTHQLSTIPHNP
ncbi:hypothetical protein PIIN_03321 [Serendipita indica DSM 11827]|uniref:Uncharacterized protein n=1 Tax=Serendipita indica (strain DSM 11827) TaxID=1109443 RepID=G4TDL7_SERID|nr:hypothetical protein PIIN_03321 [Serendipita indica DSM 11827]